MNEDYYRAALALLRFLEGRSPTERRFGAQADASWKQFRGELTTSDRIQLLIADAHAQWPGSLGPSVVWNMPGVARDDAFGPDWEPLGGVQAAALWKEIASVAAPSTLRQVLETVAAAWKLELTPSVPPDLRPGEAVFVAGPSAVAGLIEAFASHSELNWARQVVAVATSPAHRQIAAAASALLNLAEPVALLATGEALPKKTSPVVLVSDDADEADRAMLHGAGG